MASMHSIQASWWGLQVGVGISVIYLIFIVGFLLLELGVCKYWSKYLIQCMRTINPRGFTLLEVKLHFTTLNYEPCYTLHPEISFTVKLDGNMKHLTCTCVLLKWPKIKKTTPSPPPPLLNHFKKCFSFVFSSRAYQPLPTNHNPCNPKIPKSKSSLVPPLLHHHYSWKHSKW